MSRPLRIEYPGAYYHITSRGDRREAIYEDDEDRETFLRLLDDVVDRFEWRCHTYCEMTNHYHLFVETGQANLSKGMRHLKGVYTQFSNRRHGRTGHLFQGRYKAILIDSDAYFLELSRYIALNPVRAGLVEAPSDWKWSSYRATAGMERRPSCLTTNAMLAAFGKKKGEARVRYRQFVQAGIGAANIWSGLNKQIFLGDDTFGFFYA